MFQKFIIPEHSLYLQSTNFISLSFTELNNEPSLSHLHPNTEIIIPQNNYGELICNDKKTQMMKNNFYIIPSNISHTEINTNNATKAKYFTIKLHDDISMSDDYPIVIKAAEKFQELNAFICNAYHAFENNNTNYALLNLACFHLAFIKTINEYGAHDSNTQADDFIYSELTKEIEYYLSKNYNWDIKIEEVAQQHNISHSTLIKKFKKNIGVTPKEYLTQKRISAAKDLLSTSNFTITQIATFCGFISSAYFTHIFKKMNGTTPKQYRTENAKRK